VLPDDDTGDRMARPGAAGSLRPAARPLLKRLHSALEAFMRGRTWLVPLTVLAALAPAEPARACGGFFCSTQPVVQAGEEIVYALEDDGSLTMSVRLTYQGSDPDFAWLLPLPAPPELSVGSDVLFTQLRAATQPLFVTTTRVEGTCRQEPTCVRSDGSTPLSFGCGGSSAPMSTGWTGPYVDAGARPDAARVTGWDGGARSDGGVDVFSEGQVGPYDTVVLGAATAGEVLEWLASHDYQVPLGSEDMLDGYATTGHVFVALRLSTDATTAQIAPIVMHLPIEAPCLPIRLTAIATVPDLPITAWFLGRARVVPANYSVVTIDEDEARFWDVPGFYASEMTRSIDALGGRAFVTEYAGPTPRLPIALASLADVVGTTTTEIIVAVSERGYTADPAFSRLAAPFVTPPEGGTVARYLACLGVSRDATDVETCADGTGAVDAEGLAAVLEREVYEPRRRAQAMIDSHPYLTRMFTTMSAAEMTIDPEFRSEDALGDVAAVRTATVTTRCDSLHYFSGAPVQREIAGTVTLVSSGTIADDAGYCHARGLVLPSEVMRPPPARSACHCASHRGPARQWWAVGLMTIGGWARARRRAAARRRAGAENG
jgi:hypothetical protein